MDYQGKLMFKFVPIIALPLLLLNACSSAPTCNNNDPACSSNSGVTTSPPPKAPTALRLPAKISAIGYGATPPSEDYTAGQRRLMAMRASKLDAYRALTEEIHGVRITSNSTVSALISQHDSFRAYVDSYLRGAKVLTVTPLADGNYETVLELDLSDQFYDALSQPRLAANNLQTGCGVNSTAGPGCAYGPGFYHAE